MEKSELIVVLSKHQRSKVNITHIRVCDTVVTPTDRVTNIGFIVEPFMDKHIASVQTCMCVNYKYWNDSRKHINQPVVELLTHALNTSRLDTCNSLRHGLNKSQLQQLQRLHKTAARLVTLSRKFTYITPVLKQIHWLPINQRTVFKISVFIFRIIHGVSPTYMCNFV